MRTTLAFAAAAALAATPAMGLAQTPLAPVKLVLKDHRFSPPAITVPAGQKVRIELTNLDAASEEFDSLDLHVEKDVTPHGRVVFEIGPLAPGGYDFMGELHPDTAAGRVTAVAAGR